VSAGGGSTPLLELVMARSDPKSLAEPYIQGNYVCGRLACVVGGVCVGVDCVWAVVSLSLSVGRPSNNRPTNKPTEPPHVHTHKAHTLHQSNNQQQPSYRIQPPHQTNQTHSIHAHAQPSTRWRRAGTCGGTGW
jgi:hypothetical protein